MNKPIKVYLQYPWKFPDSPYYKYLIQNPPREVEYQNVSKQKGVIVNKKFFWFSNFLKKSIRKSLNNLNLAIPNAHLSPKGDYDLIHCAHCLSKNKDKPWIADLEREWSMYVGNKNKRVKQKVKKILEDKTCKKILPWTKATADEIIKEFPGIKDKVEVVYPAIPEIKMLNKKKNKEFTIIFAARYFNLKGGLIALEVLKRLKQKYGITGIVVSEVPEEVKKRYPEIEIYNLMPQEKLFNLMEESSLFLYPSTMDTFGFALLEAMAFGLPVVTINTNMTGSRREIIQNNKTGLIFDAEDKINLNKIGPNEEKIIRKLTDNCAILMHNKRLREKMSKNCLREIKDGKFSIKERNKKLKRIYKEVLK
jgi:glycosyltransferase involved in cell wall biosynthesis